LSTAHFDVDAFCASTGSVIALLNARKIAPTASNRTIELFIVDILVLAQPL
jgi:hypothetical protein